MTNFDEEARHWDANHLRIARANAVALAVRARLPLRSSMRALEYGSGTGLLSFALRPWLGHITLADSSPGMLAVLAEKVAAAGATNMCPLPLDLTTDPTPAERFQLIYTLMTLHHIADTDKILRDFHTLLEPDGWICIADLDQEDGSFHGIEVDVHHGFDRDELSRHAAQVGFADIQFQTVFSIAKERESGTQDYPVFLMTARRAGT